MQLFSLHICIIQPYIHLYTTMLCLFTTYLPSLFAQASFRTWDGDLHGRLMVATKLASQVEKEGRHRDEARSCSQLPWEMKFMDIHEVNEILLGCFFFHPAICIDEQGRIMSLDMYLYLPLTIGKFWFSVHHWPAPFCGLSVFTKRNVGAKVPGKEGGGSKNAQFTTTVITWDQMVITSWKNHPITRITPGVFGRFRCDKSFCLFGAQVFLEEF